MQATRGFDLSPPLANTTEDFAKWARLLARVKQHYVFWPNENIRPKEDHLAILPGEGYKLPRDSTKFHSLVSSHSNENNWDAIAIISIVARYAVYEFGHQRVRYFSSPSPEELLPEGREEKSGYSVIEASKLYGGAYSEVDADWATYGGEPDEVMWDSFATRARNSWLPTGSPQGEERTTLQEEEYFAWRTKAKTRAWNAIKILRLCHRFGNLDSASVCKLPVELVDKIEEAPITAEGAPASFNSMVVAYQENPEYMAGLKSRPGALL